MGMIGVGKTTLLENAVKHHHVPVFKEYVVQAILADFIRKAPWMTAFNFQAVMMQSACARLKDALSLAHARLVPEGSGPPLAASSSELTAPNSQCTHSALALLAHNVSEGRVILHERPPLENRIFALANRIVGGMTEKDHETYTTYVDEMLTMARESDVPPLNVLLWAPPEKTTANMQQRGTESEQEYDVDYYLSCLHHVYFLNWLAHESEHGYVVIDWSRYGRYSDLTTVLEAAIKEGGGQLRARIVHTHQTMDKEALEPVLPDDLVGPVLMAKKPNNNNNNMGRTYHLDLNAYMKLSIHDRSSVQQAVFKGAAWSKNGYPPVVARLYVHGMTDRQRLYSTQSRYAKDPRYHAPTTN